MFLRPKTLMSTMPRAWLWFTRATAYQYPISRANCFNFCTKTDEKVNFDKLDGDSIFKIMNKGYYNKVWKRKMDQWKIPLARKQARRERKLEREAEFVPPEHQNQLFVVHNPTLPVTYPQDPYGIFAVIKINGKQYKVTKDCSVRIETIPFEVGHQIIIDQVMMIGTKDYTSVGRPFVETAKVFATVEEESRTEKVIIFKKQRREGYQRNKGHRQNIMCIRIDSIVHELGEEQASNYEVLKN